MVPRETGYILLERLKGSCFKAIKCVNRNALSKKTAESNVHLALPVCESLSVNLWGSAYSSHSFSLPHTDTFSVWETLCFQLFGVSVLVSSIFFISKSIYKPVCLGFLSVQLCNFLLYGLLWPLRMVFLGKYLAQVIVLPFLLPVL